MRDEFVRNNAELKEYKKVLKAKETEEIRKIEDYAVAKEMRENLKKRKEQERFERKQAIRQKIIDEQIENLARIKSREDEILSKHKVEAEAKYEANEKSKRDKFMEAKRQMDDFRELTVAKRTVQKEMEKKADKNFVDLWKMRMKDLEREEKTEKQEIYCRNKNLERINLNMAENRKISAAEQFVKDNEEALKTKLMLQTENSEFLEFSEDIIKEYAAQGKEIGPLLLELKKYRKRLTNT